MSKPYTGDRNLLTGFIIFVLLVTGFFVWNKIETNKRESMPGIADYKAGRYKIAIQKLDAYLVQHPYTVSNHTWPSASATAGQYLGKAYLNDHQDQKAIDTFSNSYISNAHNTYWIGIALMDQGKLSEARTAFKRSIEMSSKGDAGWESAADEKINEIDYIESQHVRR